MKKDNRLPRKLVSCALAVVLACTPLTAAAQTAQTTAAEAGGFSASFADPVRNQRMKVRTWWPSADITAEEIAAEVKEIADAGFGGIELIGITESFAGRGQSVIDPEVNGWATDNWNKAVETLMQEAEKYGISVDLTIGPRWPAGIPNLDPNSDAAYRVLKYAASVQTLEAGSSTLTLPEAPSDQAELVAVVSAKYLGSTNTVAAGGGGWPGGGPGGPGGSSKKTVTEHMQIDESTLKVIPLDQIDTEKGTFTVDGAEAGDYAFFTYWAVASNQTSGDTSPTAYVINHFGLSGTEAILNFWEDHMLTDAVKAHFEKYGGDIFEDSLELSSADLPWCDGMAEYFQENHGYSLLESLPLLVGKLSSGSSVTKTADADIGEGDNKVTAGSEYNYKFDVAAKDTAEQAVILDDYATNLNDMYIENHIIPIQKWCASHNIRYRAQAQGTSDNNWVDSIEAASYLDVAEGETLGMSKSPDAFRSLAGAANMSGKGIVSVEIGAEFGALYQVSWQRLTELVNRVASVGVNQYVLHGFATRSQYCSNTKWPGWMPFDEPRFSETWNNTNPAWDYMSELTDYVSRLQTALQYGKAKVDFAVYRDDLGIRTDEGNTKGVLYLDEKAVPSENPATAVGYSYNYLSPSNFKLENGVVENGMLNPDDAGYRALVINNETDMELADAQQILTYAKEGLPVVLVGQTPVTDGTHGAEDDEAVQAVFAELKTMANVAAVADEADLPAALKSLGVQPSASYDACNLITQHRRSEDADLYFLFNQTSFYDYSSNNVYHDDNAVIHTTVTLEGKGQPYQLNPYSGEITQIAEYKDNGDGTISVDVTLMDGEATILGLTADRNYFGSFSTIQAVNNGETGKLVVKDGQVVLQTSEAGDYDVTVNGLRTTGTVDEVAAPISLDSNWSLTVTSYQPGDQAKLDSKDENYDPTQIDKVVLPTVALDTLKDWSQIEGLENISGRGEYTTTFTLEGKFDGAMLDLGEIYDGILAVYINGQKLPPVDQFNHIVDLGQYVVQGENTLKVITGTTLAKAVRAAGGNCAPRDSFTAYPTTYGLLGGVKITPYVQAALSGVLSDVAVKLSGPADATPAAESLTYQIGVAGAEKLATATLYISVDNLKNPVAEGLNGWYIIAQKETDGVLQVLLANNDGLSGDGDLLAVTGETTGKLGAAGLTVTKAVLSSYLDEREIFVNADLTGASVRTEIAYSTYDVNQDGCVDQLDITRAQRAYGTSDGDDRWNALADVNRDGTVDINDLILILNHYGD